VLEWAADRKIILKLGSFTADFTSNTDIDPMIEGMILMMGTFAQIERKITVQRVKSGVANARAKGVLLGRPSLVKDKLPQVFVDHYPAYKAGKLKKAEYSRLCGISRPTLYRYLALYDN
jgi:DNA invertase Pin-like site-specific DNA recombinase